MQLKTDKKSIKFSISTLLKILTLIFLILIIYSRIYNHEFISLDTNNYTYSSPYKNGYTPTNFIRIFSAPYFGNYQPLTLLSHMTDIQLFGMSPGKHHMMSLFIHLIGTLLLFKLVYKLTEEVNKSFFVAFIYGLHPIHVESVAWIAARKDLLVALFWFSILLLYTNLIKKNNNKTIPFRSWLLITVLYCFGFLTKSSIITLPIVLVLLDYWPLNRIHSIKDIIRSLSEKVFLFINVAVLCAITYIFHKSARAVGNSLTLWERVGHALVSYIDYLLSFLWPFNLTLFYPHPIKGSFFETLMAGIIIITIFIIVFKLKNRPIIFGLLFFLTTSLPTIGLIQFGSHARADRFLHIPSIGLSIMIIWGISEMSKNLKTAHVKLFIKTSTHIYLCLLIFITAHYLSYWKNNFVLYEQALKTTKNNFIIANHLGVAYFVKGDTETAIKFYKRAFAINPDFYFALLGWAKALEVQKKYLEAAKKYLEAYQIRPKPYIVNYACNLLFKQDQQKSGDSRFFKLFNKETSAMALNKLGEISLKNGEKERAIVYFNQAIKIFPDCVKAKINLEKLKNNIR